MDQVEVSVVTLSNGNRYEIIDKIKYNNENYLFLVNEENDLDRCIRKQIIENDKEIFKTLTKEEFQNVIALFIKKYGGENGK